MHRLSVFILIWFGLIGCVSREILVESIGVMQLRRHKMIDHIDWESNTWIDKEEICPPSGENCISAKQLNYKVGNGLLWVGIDEYRSPQTPHAMYFFDTNKGTQILCLKCKKFIKTWHVGSGWWLDANKFVAYTSNRDHTEGGIFVAHITKTVEINVLKQSDFKWDKDLYGASTSPDNRNIAWYECTPICTLFWLNDDYSKILSESTNCATDRLQIYWKNGRPMNGHLAGTGSKIGCRNAKGELRFPILRRVINGHAVPVEERDANSEKN